MSLDFKTCTNCYQHKPYEMFPFSRRYKSKRHSICKKCNAARSKQWRLTKEAKYEAWS